MLQRSSFRIYNIEIYALKLHLVRNPDQRIQYRIHALARRHSSSPRLAIVSLVRAPNQCYGQFTREISYKTLDLSTHQPLPLPPR